MTAPNASPAAAPPCPLRVLTINGGSSSIKFALFAAGDPPQRLLSGQVERIGLADPTLTVAGAKEKRPIQAATPEAAAEGLLAFLAERSELSAVSAVGHRVVHGGPHFSQPACVSAEMLTELRRISPFDPEHLPTEIELIEIVGRRFPAMIQVACFDTAFHTGMPRVAQLLPIPRRYEAQGLRRYGFHGLSYAYLMEELERLSGATAARGRVVLAHLGNGASVTACRDGKSVDTSMGFTPTAGVPMSTRSGDIDPGLVWYLARTEGMSPEQFHEMVNHQSGLLGVSETSPDMRDLLGRHASDARAAEAVELFCYQVRKWIGGLAAILGGLDTLVFSGGIGEHSPEVRAGICRGLEFLGIVLDEGANAANAPVISAASAAVPVRVIPTDEEITIARSVLRLLGPGSSV